MSSLIRPVLIESCNITLRGRRRSSVHPLNSLPNHITTEASNVSEEQAIIDDIENPHIECPQPFAAPYISPLTNAHISEYATTVATARTNRLVHYTIEETSSCSSPPSTAVNSRATSPVKHFEEEEDDEAPKYNGMRWRLASGYFSNFAGGWADGVTGTVLPYLMAQFHLNTTTSSLLFVGTTIGFFAGTFLVEFMMNFLGACKVGRTQRPFLSASVSRFLFPASRIDHHGYSASQARHFVLVVASTTQSLYFILMGSRSGFPAMFVAYVLAAFARAVLTAPLNAYFASGPKQALGYAFGLASFGSVLSPLVCQVLIAAGVPWYQFYYGSLLISAINITLLATTFRPTVDEFRRERRQALNEAGVTTEKFSKTRSSSPIGLKAGTLNCRGSRNIETPQPRSALGLCLAMPYQWAISLFALLYCGSETVTQGYMVTYLLQNRHANPKTVGYVTSGFWGGISLGRFIYGACTPYLSFTQRKHAVHGCFAVVMHLLIWFINSSVQNAISASLIGVLYGPIFPACLSMANDILPAEVHMVAMAVISSFASLGGAILPFIAGIILDKMGVHALTYITVPLAAAMGCLWTLFPSRQPVRTTLD